MFYKNHSDEELRSVLIANPKDAEAIVEAADRFVKGEISDDILKCGDCGSYDVRSA